jgi:MinD-like ATPase involved in chromosome partitioning or flagellar assembly
VTVARTQGSILTFYSYKGGAGRTMALANVAWLLAAAGHRVCAIDWDLEAPGLHRYFHPFLIDPELTSTDGIIDYVWDVSTRALTPATDDVPDAVDVLDYTVRVPWEFEAGGRLDLLPAGRQDSGYAARVNAFDWINFYERLGGGKELEEARGRLRDRYDYVLIDSRTGVSDTSGICTLQMPDCLVVCYALNRQSVDGAAGVAETVREQRPEMQIFPVEMRVETDEKEKLEATRRAARRQFERYINGDPELYWNGAEILYWPYYAFEEVLAAFGDDPGARSPSTMSDRMERLAMRLSGHGDIRTPEIDELTRLEIQDKWSLGCADAKTPRLPPQPLDAGRAMSMGYTRLEYEHAAGWFGLLWRIHLQTAREGRPGPPDPETQRLFLRPATLEAEDLLGEAATTHLDPCLERAEAALVTARQLVDEVNAWPHQEFRCEGQLCTVAEARKLADELTNTIKRDVRSGYRHHSRLSPWWRVVVVLLTFFEVPAIVVVLADLFNIAPEHPLATPAQTFTVLTLSIITAASQAWCAGRAGWWSNRRREPHAQSYGEASAVGPSGWLWASVTLVLAAAVTTVLVQSQVSIVKAAGLGPGWQAVGGLLGVVLGLGTPLVRFCSIAGDGSSTSRRRDAFAAALDDYRRDREDAEYDARLALQHVDAHHEKYISQCRPEVLRRARVPLVAAEKAMELLNVMLGLARSPSRRQPDGSDEAFAATVRDEPVALPNLHWGLKDAPEVDNEQLSARDRAFQQQAERAGVLRDELIGTHRMRRNNADTTSAGDARDKSD